ncbi:thiaminase II [Alloscardovia omnicolens]|uniref:thiaminase II n=1 Tax=Alloscardovia omnicolens TaxID=419015 RepID=UPI003A5E9855
MMTTTERLLADSTDIWEQYYTHPFILGLQNGDLDKDKFRFYIVQDYLYLEEYAQVFALGAAKAKTHELMQVFAGILGAISGVEMNIHNGYMGTFNVKADELSDSARSLDNLSYTSYMLRIAYEGTEVDILAAILSCAISYEYIAKNIVKNNPQAADHEFYGSWIQCYSGEEYAKTNQDLVATLNRLTQDYSEAQLCELSEIFRRCSQYELAFWDMGWNKSMA